MTDEMTTGPVPYRLPALCVRATYPATDGRVPEEIAVEFGDGPVDPDLVDRAVAALARVAATRGVPDFIRLEQPAAGAAWSRTDEVLANASREIDANAKRRLGDAVAVPDAGTATGADR